MLVNDIKKNKVEAEAYEVEIFDEEKYTNFRLKYLNLRKRKQKSQIKIFEFSIEKDSVGLK